LSSSALPLFVYTPCVCGSSPPEELLGLCGLGRLSSRAERPNLLLQPSLSTAATACLSPPANAELDFKNWCQMFLLLLIIADSPESRVPTSTLKNQWCGPGLGFASGGRRHGGLVATSKTSPVYMYKSACALSSIRCQCVPRPPRAMRRTL
jgi:hypothetical protein